MIFWLWSSTLAGKAWSTKFPIAAIPMRMLTTKQLRMKANQTITELIAWDCCLASVLSLQGFFEGPLIFFPAQGSSLLTGRFPTHDEHGALLRGLRGGRAGQDICGGWKAVFESWTGDWKERKLSHCFQKRNYQSTLLCDQCRAVQPHAKTPHSMLHLIYSNFNLDAPWTRTQRSHEQYVEETPSELRTPWLRVPGFHISRIRWDVAHTILLGCGKDIAGSFLCDVATRHANLKASISTTRIRNGQSTPSSVCPG